MISSHFSGIVFVVFVSINESGTLHIICQICDKCPHAFAVPQGRNSVSYMVNLTLYTGCEKTHKHNYTSYMKLFDACSQQVTCHCGMASVKKKRKEKI